MPSKSELSARKRAVVAGLVSGLSKQGAAGAVGIRPETVSRYMRDPVFRSALQLAQDEGLAHVARRMVAGAGEMLDVLASVATDSGMPPGVRIRAASVWLAEQWRALELRDLAGRVEALERQTKAKR